MERGVREWRKVVKLYENGYRGRSYGENRYEEVLKNGEEAGN